MNARGVDHKVLRELLLLCEEPVFNSRVIDQKLRKRGGRPWEVDAVGVLALLLFWCRAGGSSAKGISPPCCFGLTAANTRGWLCSGQGTLLCTLNKHPAARVGPPTKKEAEECTGWIAAKHPLL